MCKTGDYLLFEKDGYYHLVEVNEARFDRPWAVTFEGVKYSEPHYIVKNAVNLFELQTQELKHESRG